MSFFNPDPQTRFYKVATDSKVTATAVIGNAQRGGWAMRVTGQSTVKGSASEAVSLGVGSALVGKFLQVDVTAVDVRPETNRLSAVVTIAGGPAGPLEVAQELQDNGDGDVALFSTLVIFQ